MVKQTNLATMAEYKQTPNPRKHNASLLVRLVKREAIGERMTACWWRKVHRFYSASFGLNVNERLTPVKLTPIA